MNNEDMSDILGKMNNISPDMINNLMNMLNNNTSSNSNTSHNNLSHDATYYSSNSSSTSNTSSSQTSNLNSDGMGIDIETILKMKKMIDSMNTKNDPRSNLLQSLKPYLNDSRKSKVDQYIQLMNMSKVLDVFPFLGGEQKNDR